MLIQLDVIIGVISDNQRALLMH